MDWYNGKPMPSPAMSHMMHGILGWPKTLTHMFLLLAYPNTIKTVPTQTWYCGVHLRRITGMRWRLNLTLSTLTLRPGCMFVKVHSCKFYIPFTWAFKCKCQPDGGATKFKACFVVYDDHHKKGVGYFETWVPMWQWSDIFTMIVLAAKDNICLDQCDITAAFFHVKLSKREDIYIHQIWNPISPNNWYFIPNIRPWF